MTLTLIPGTRHASTVLPARNCDYASENMTRCEGPKYVQL